MINGDPFRFHVNQPRLASVINYVRKKGERAGRQEPRFLEVRLGESLPPKLAGTSKEAGDPPIHNYQRYGFEIELPKEIVKSDTPTKDLVEQVEAVANNDLKTGIIENLHLKNSLAVRRLGSQALLAAFMAAGEGVGVATSSDHIPEMLLKGSGYALLGIVATGVLVATKNIYRVQKYGSSLALIAKKAYKSARSENWVEYSKSVEEYFQEPIISLVPAGEQDATA